MSELINCKIEVKMKLNFDNVGDVYEFVKQYSSDTAVERCLKFLDANAKELINDDAFTRMPRGLVKAILSRDTFFAKEVDIFKGVMRWHDRHPNCDLNELLFLLRWNRINAIDYASHIRPCRVISDDDYFQWNIEKTADRIPPNDNKSESLEVTTFSEDDPSAIFENFTTEEVVESGEHGIEIRSEVDEQIDGIGNHYEAIANRYNSTRSQLTAHYTAISTGGVEQFTCKYCSFSVNEVSVVIRHLNTVHLDRVKPT